MLGVGDTLPPVTGVNPGFNNHEENSVSATEELAEQSFAGKWKVISFSSAALNGCGTCNPHEAVLSKEGAAETTSAVVRFPSVIQSTAIALEAATQAA